MRVKSGSIPSLRRRAQRGIAFAIAVAAVALVAPVALGAQGTARTDGPIAPFSTFYVTTGTLLMDASRLNAHFERTDLPATQRPGFYTIANHGYSVGFGGYGAVMNRVVVGGEYHMANMGSETSPSGKTNELVTSYWMGTVGYAALTLWKLNFIPFAGVGLGSSTLTLKSRDAGPKVPDAFSPTFDEVIASPGSKSQMKGSYVMVQPGLALDLLVLESDASRVGFTVGLRFASAISPHRTTWTYGGKEVFGGPDLGPTGGTVRIVAGIGGFRLGR